MRIFFGVFLAAAFLAVGASAAAELYSDTHVALKYEGEEMPLGLSAEAKALPPGTKVAVLELEDGAAVEIQLLEDETPETAANFIRLVEDKFYDGIPFHRVVPDFVVQAGDATLVGRENPDISLEVEPDVRECLRGAVSMARLAHRDEYTDEVIYGATSPTQFFVLKKDSPHLDDNFCVFGVVVAGMGIVDGIEQGDLIKRIRILTVEEAETAAVEE
jgi:peptidyl-prolyl cis-trans isomerase B (cyclophilin B)